ncbi:hypothetical protein RCC89_03125 [Cytophagaceae bacterium ABcell3]|nr:hypothetical protein RCC89_03125 [Cytophagaceae bacterium ABcell3]
MQYHIPQNVFQAIDAIVVILDRQYNIQNFTSSFEEIFGGKVASGLKGKPVDQLSYQIYDWLYSNGMAKENSKIIIALEDKDGIRKKYRVNIKALSDEFTGYVLTFDEIDVVFEKARPVYNAQAVGGKSFSTLKCSMKTIRKLAERDLNGPLTATRGILNLMGDESFKLSELKSVAISSANKLRLLHWQISQVFKQWENIANPDEEIYMGDVLNEVLVYQNRLVEKRKAVVSVKDMVLTTFYGNKQAIFRTVGNVLFALLNHRERISPSILNIMMEEVEGFIKLTVIDNGIYVPDDADVLKYLGWCDVCISLSEAKLHFLGGKIEAKRLQKEKVELVMWVKK